VIIGWTYSQKLPGYEVKQNHGSDRVNIGNLPQIKSNSNFLEFVKQNDIHLGEKES
jgi:hypothetical protein